MDRILSPHHTTRFITNKNGMERSSFQAGLPASSAVSLNVIYLLSFETTTLLFCVQRRWVEISAWNHDLRSHTAIAMPVLA